MKAGRIQDIFLVIAGGLAGWFYSDVQAYKNKYKDAQHKYDSVRILLKKDSSNAIYNGPDSTPILGAIMPGVWTNCDSLSPKWVVEYVRNNQYTEKQKDGVYTVLLYPCFGLRFLYMPASPFKQVEWVGEASAITKDGVYVFDSNAPEAKKVESIILNKYNF